MVHGAGARRVEIVYTPRCQCGGQGFESRWLHLKVRTPTPRRGSGLEYGIGSIRHLRGLAVWLAELM